MSFRWLVLVLLHSVAAIAGDPYTEGRAIGDANKTLLKNSLTEQKANEIPYYSDSKSAPEKNSFGGGMGNVIGAGWGAVDGCKANPNDPNPARAQSCDATNFLYQNATDRPRFDLKNTDPALTGMRNANKNPSAYLPPGTGQGTYSACTPVTKTTPGVYETQVCNEYMDYTQPECSVGRIIEVDADSNFQCEKTISAYEQQSCKITMGATVSGASGSDARLVVANFGSVFLFTGGGVSGVWMHNAAGSEFPIGSGTYSGATLGIDTPGNAYKIDVTHNNCANGLCTGSALLSLWRQFNGTWLGQTRLEWQQYTQNQSLCSLSAGFGIGLGYRGGGGCTISSSSCPSGNQSTISYSCSNPYSSYSGTATLSVGGYAYVEFAQTSTGFDYDCGGASWVTYNGNGSFSFSTSGRAGGSCGEAGTNSTTFGYPVQQYTVTINKNDGCAGFAERAR